MGTGTGTGRSEDGSGDGNGDENNGNENDDRIGEGKKEAKNARNRKIVVNAMPETGETWVERGKSIENRGLVP